MVSCLISKYLKTPKTIVVPSFFHREFEQLGTNSSVKKSIKFVTNLTSVPRFCRNPTDPTVVSDKIWAHFFWFDGLCQINLTDELVPHAMLNRDKEPVPPIWWFFFFFAGQNRVRQRRAHVWLRGPPPGHGLHARPGLQESQPQLRQWEILLPHDLCSPVERCRSPLCPP